MNFKKTAASVIAVIMAVSICMLPADTNTDLFSTDVYATETTNDDFIVETKKYTGKTLVGYKGKGGAVTIPADIDIVGKNAFKGNSTITSLTIASGVSDIYSSAFEGCTKLETVTFKGDIDAVAENAFSKCPSLKTVVFEGDVRVLHSNSFFCCPSLKTVTFKGNITSPLSDENAVYGGIWDKAFSDCYNLKSVEFAKDSIVDAIGRNAFYNCFKLTSINFPSGLREIHMDAFGNCLNLKSAAIPPKTKVSPRAFGYTYNIDGGKNQFIVADGKAKGKDTVYDTDDKSLTSTKTITFTQKAITLIVSKGSPAEKYAVKNDIRYKYAPNGLAAPVGITSAASANKITLKWFAVADADAYTVYIYNAETGKYKKYKTVTGTSCTVDALSKNTKYKFKIAAVKKVSGKYKSGESSAPFSVSTKKGK
ncbi:MAG: leucine-rich repeat protein [Oscillospiraceae bacterium]|nr:leucine-rich repeat protein [Oscillospiraceae bacterium]